MTFVESNDTLFYQTLVYFVFGALFIAFCFYFLNVINEMGLLDKKLLLETEKLLVEDHIEE